MSSCLPSTFNSKDFEKKIYDLWLKNACFTPTGTNDPYVIVIPPPNVTGILHMGHGLNNTLQDILIRYMRMRGRNTLWIPGSDHAGIATQSVVERMLKAEGKSRLSVGRDAFVQKTWDVCNSHKAQITEQLQALGASCDWSRYRFTLDPALSNAVTEVFIRLYEKGLIYKGSYMVNWSVQNQTAISNEEVEYKETRGRLYYVRYPLTDGSSEIKIATTRPETIFGDTAIAVHPDDERYKDIVGKAVHVPLSNRTIPIIADELVDPEFGTGALKITPAHDNKDYEIGLRHNLETRKTMNPDGKLNELVPEPYQNLDMKTARKRVAEDLEKAELLIRTEEHLHQVGYCHRTGDIIEPYPSEQWFVKMQPLAERALQSWGRGELRFHPAKWANTYRHWMNTLRDWCISRQLWWGHRIPAWYDDETGEMIVSSSDPSTLDEYRGRSFTQDESVLDTWFSSWLWPFSTLGWPEDTEDLATYYPTSTLITGYDIIFFWVARMVMAGLEFTGKSPFSDVYITNLIRDKQGRKMSKSLGNGIDPRDVIHEVGADAMRFTLAFNTALGSDILIGMEDFQFGSRFANKLWNAARFILTNAENRKLIALQEIEFDHIDKWIYHRLNVCKKEVQSAFEQHRFNEASQYLYEYLWNDFCDWYLEASKLHHNGEEAQDRIVSLLLCLLEEILKLLHPFMPFITEELYQKLPALPRQENPHPFIIQAPYPVFESRHEYLKEVTEVEGLQAVVRTVRTLRSEFTIAFSRPVSFTIRYDDDWVAATYIKQSTNLITMLTNAKEITYCTSIQRDPNAIVSVGKNFEVHMFIKDMIDVQTEHNRLARSLEKKERLVKQVQAKLSNKNFLSNAKEDIIAREYAKENELIAQLEKIRVLIKELE